MDRLVEKSFQLDSIDLVERLIGQVNATTVGPFAMEFNVSVVLIAAWINSESKVALRKIG